MKAERLTDHPSDAVTLNATAGSLHRHGEAESRPALVIGDRGHAEESIAESPPVLVSRLEFRLATQAPCRGKREPPDCGGHAIAGQALRDKLLAALGAAPGQDGSAILRRHASTEAMRARTPHFARLVGALHCHGCANPSVPKRAARLSR